MTNYYFKKLNKITITPIREIIDIDTECLDWTSWTICPPLSKINYAAHNLRDALGAHTSIC